MSDASRRVDVDQLEVPGVQKRCFECGHTDTAGRRKLEEVDGVECYIVVCPECESARWGSDGIRRIAGVTEPEVGR